MAEGKFLEKAIVNTAKVAWPLFQSVNKLFRDGKSEWPKWAPGKIKKSYERSCPPLGFPRKTDSLCPKCVKEVRDSITSGETDFRVLLEGGPGEIPADIIERDGKVFMVKECSKHGKFEDILSTDARFQERIENLFPGRDFISPKSKLRNHGTSTMKYGRGSVLTVDLTNRCNMMCEPCFMDANQVGYVHELDFEGVKEILDNSLKIKPRRQLSVQFSGGEPTISPYFIDAIKYAKKIGYFSVQAATNGIRFAEDPKFAQEAADAGLRIAYLQFDGIGNLNNEHRKIKNLFDVKLRAMENLYNAGVDIVLVVTIINTVNEHQVGPIVEFAIQNSDKISFIAFQPVSFTGRDEDISEEDRLRQRYTLSHLAHDIKKQTGISEPMRDWFPLSSITTFANLGDVLNPRSGELGNMSCGCHPNCGVIMAIMANKRTKEWKPVTEFMDLEQFIKDCDRIADSNRGAALTKSQIGMALLRNIDPTKFPKGLTLKDLLTKFDKQTGGTVMNGDYGTGPERKKDEWLFLFVAGMWFQDLFTYDFRRTEMCSIPYGTQLGEVSFCAYNTGLGWRNIIENMHKNATVGEWYKKHGRHEVYAGGTPMELPSFDHTLEVRDKWTRSREEALRAKEEQEAKDRVEEEPIGEKEEKEEKAEETRAARIAIPAGA